MQKKCRQHPIKIFSFMKRNFWLLSIPLIRGLAALRFDFDEWLRGAWLDLLIVTVIVLFAVLTWLTTVYIFQNESISVDNGIFFRHKKTILFSSISSCSIESSFFLRPFKVCVLYIDTNSGSRKKTDVSLMISKRDAVNIMKGSALQESSSSIKCSHYPSRLHMVFFSLIFSDTLSGVILIATLVNQSGKIISGELENRFVTTLDTFVQKVAFVLPRTAAIISIVMLGGWGLSLVLNMLRHWNFSASRQGDGVTINNGFLTKRSYFLSRKKINYVDLRQRLFSIIFKVSSVHIHCTGYGKKKREIAVLIPITTKDEVTGSMNLLLPDFPQPEVTIKPTLFQISRFIFMPVVGIIAVPIVALTLMLFFSRWAEIILFASVMLEIPLFWLLIVKTVSNFTSGIGYFDKTYTLKYCKGFEYHTIFLPEDKISMVKFEQNPFQRASGNCNLVVYTNAERVTSHEIKFLPSTEILEFLKNRDIDLNFA